MTREVVALFSSDARELYKADIFRVLSLPHKYVIHFRYDGKYIQQDLLVNLDSLLNKEGIIFFTSGNDLSKTPEERIISLHAIRNVLIKDIQLDRNVKLFHFYLELGNFCDCVPHSDTPKQLLPPNKFISRIYVEDGPNNNWIDRIMVVKDHFADHPLFYLVDNISHAGKELIPKYSSIDKSSYFELSDETEYRVKFSFYDPTEGKQGLMVTNIGDLVNLVIPPNHRVGAIMDNEVFILFTQSLTRMSLLGLSRVKGVFTGTQVASSPTPDLTVELRWRVVRTWHKIIMFGFYSALAAMGVIGIATTTKDFSTTSFTGINILLGLISILIVGLAAALLYSFYNKK